MGRSNTPAPRYSRDEFVMVISKRPLPLACNKVQVVVTFGKLPSNVKWALDGNAKLTLHVVSDDSALATHPVKPVRALAIAKWTVLVESMHVVEQQVPPV